MYNFFNNFSVHYQSYTRVSYATIVQTSAGNSYNDYQVATFRDHLVWWLFSKTLLYLVLHTMYPI